MYMYVFAQNFIQLSAAVHDLSWWQKLCRDAENNAVVATTDSNKAPNLPLSSYSLTHASLKLLMTNLDDVKRIKFHGRRYMDSSMKIKKILVSEEKVPSSIKRRIM